MTAKIKPKNRKVNVLVLLTAGEIEFLNRKIDKRYEEKSSRSALIRLLVRRAMENPKLLDPSWEGA